MLATERLRLCPLQQQDFEVCYRDILGNPRVMTWMKTGRALSEEEAREQFSHWVTHGAAYPYWGIALKTTGMLVGYCGLRQLDDTAAIELTYAIAPSHWGQGIVPEAAAAVLVYGFEQLGCDRIWARTGLTHQASQAVMVKLGMKLTGDRPPDFARDVARNVAPNTPDVVFYTLSRQEFISLR
ncbi:MAG TPA: GNAT family N-acetyltransferase [Chroococcidiopsis sp.]